MASKKVYLITIPNWEKHNPKKNKGYTYFMFHNGFFSDAKVSQLRQIEILLFIYLLCIASELKTNSFQIHVKLLPKCLRMHDKLLHNSLISLQSLQLLTYAPLNKIKGIEENRKEENRIEKNTSSKEEEDEKPKIKKSKVPDVVTQESFGQVSVLENPQPPAKKNDLVNLKMSQAIAAYCIAFKNRYNARPTLTGKDRGILKRVCNDIPIERLCEMLQVYVQMEDPWFIKKKHDLTTFENSLNKIGVSHQTGTDDNRKADPFSFFDEKSVGVL